MATAQVIVEAAFSRSTKNDPGKLAVDGEMIGTLDRVHQTLYAVAAVAAPERHTVGVNLVLAASIATIPTDSIDLRRVEGFAGTVAAGSKINVIPVEEKDRSWHIAPRMYRLSSTLVSLGGVGDPGAADMVKLFHLDAPAAITVLGSTTDARFPKRYDELLIVTMAIYLSTKDAGRDMADFNKLNEYWKSLLTMFLNDCGLSMTALQTPHGGVIMQKLNAILAGNKAAAA